RAYRIRQLLLQIEIIAGGRGGDKVEISGKAVVLGRTVMDIGRSGDVVAHRRQGIMVDQVTGRQLKTQVFLFQELRTTAEIEPDGGVDISILGVPVAHSA